MTASSPSSSKRRSVAVHTVEVSSSTLQVEEPAEEYLPHDALPAAPRPESDGSHILDALRSTLAAGAQSMLADSKEVMLSALQTFGDATPDQSEALEGAHARAAELARSAIDAITDPEELLTLYDAFRAGQSVGFDGREGWSLRLERGQGSAASEVYLVSNGASESLAGALGERVHVGSVGGVARGRSHSRRKRRQG